MKKLLILLIPLLLGATVELDGPWDRYASSNSNAAKLSTHTTRALCVSAVPTPGAQQCRQRVTVTKTTDPVLPPPPPGLPPGVTAFSGALPAGYAACSAEDGWCLGTGKVAYGAGTTWRLKDSAGSVACTNDVFGDPTPGVLKVCRLSGVVAPPPPPPPGGALSVNDPRVRYRLDASQTFKQHDARHPFNTVLAGSPSGGDWSMGQIGDPLMDPDGAPRLERIVVDGQWIIRARIKDGVTPWHNGSPRLRAQIAASELNSLNQNIRFNQNYWIAWAFRPHQLIPAGSGYAFVGMGGFHTVGQVSSSTDPFHVFLTRTGYVISVAGDGVPGDMWGDANGSSGFYRDNTGVAVTQAMHYFVMRYRASTTNGHVEIYRRIGRTGPIVHLRTYSGGPTTFVDSADNTYHKPGLYAGVDSLGGRSEYKLDMIGFQVIRDEAPTLTKEALFAYLDSLGKQ